jgi:hypothetical protein
MSSIKEINVSCKSWVKEDCDIYTALIIFKSYTKKSIKIEGKLQFILDYIKLCDVQINNDNEYNIYIYIYIY